MPTGLPRGVHSHRPRAAPPDSWRSLRSARVPPMHYLDKPPRPSLGAGKTVKLNRFGGALQAFRGGFTDAQDTSAIRTGISPSNGRTGPGRPTSGRACPGVRTDRTVDQPLG